jgi:hypothetical protein
MLSARSRTLFSILPVAVVASIGICTAGCGSRASTPASGPSTTASAQVRAPMTIAAQPLPPVIDPASFSTKIDNPYLPLTPGTRMIYEADTADGKSRTTTEVTRDTKKIMGIDTVVVHDTVTLNGKPSEDTFDWYAQDREGNVWYFGEDTKDFSGGKVDTGGSFEAGVNGAFAGIVMPAHPQVGDKYRQEFSKGVAEDTGEVLGLNSSETTPLTGPKDNLLVIADGDLLDPTAPPEHKYYAPGIGLILTTQQTDPAEREHAVSVEKF